jgi:hypothetical protein
MLCLIRVLLFGLVFVGMTFLAVVRGVVHTSHAEQRPAAATSVRSGGDRL